MVAKSKTETSTTKNKNIPLEIKVVMALAVVGTLFFVRPYIGVVLLSALIAFMFNPVYQYVFRKTKKSSLAVVSTLATAFLAFILPVSIVLLVTVDQVQSIVHKFESGEITVGSANIQEAVDRGVDRVNDVLTAIPGGEKVEVSKGDISETVRTASVKLLDGLVGFITATGTAVAGLITTSILAVFLIIAMLLYQKEVIDFLKKISPFDNSINNLYLARTSAITKAMVKGQFIIASIQGTLSALSLWLVGLDLFWFFLTILVFLSFIPLGAGIVTIPIGVVLILTGNIPQGLFVILFHLLVVTNVDNILRPKLVPKSARLNSAVLLLSVFSGLALFGFSGIVIGPVIMILLMTTFEIYAKYNEGREKPALAKK